MKTQVFAAIVIVPILVLCSCSKNNIEEAGAINIGDISLVGNRTSGLYEDGVLVKTYLSAFKTVGEKSAQGSKVIASTVFFNTVAGNDDVSEQIVDENGNTSFLIHVPTEYICWDNKNSQNITIKRLEDGYEYTANFADWKFAPASPSYVKDGKIKVFKEDCIYAMMTMVDGTVFEIIYKGNIKTEMLYAD